MKEITLKSDWEFGVFGVYNYKKIGKLKEYFKFIKESYKSLDGDVCEVGVYRGYSIIATAMLLKEIGSDKKIWGFDSFSGFPSYHANDDLSMFEGLYKQGLISLEHYQDYNLNIKHKEFLSDVKVDPSNISTSSDFSETSKSLLERKIDYLGLDNIVLVDGDYQKTMQKQDYIDLKFMAVLMDCDLYESHKIALPFVWKRMVSSGYMYLDEYYSLKFPGARIATNEFFSDKLDHPEMYMRQPMDFERWFVRKKNEK